MWSGRSTTRELLRLRMLRRWAQDAELSRSAQSLKWHWPGFVFPLSGGLRGKWPELAPPCVLTEALVLCCQVKNSFSLFQYCPLLFLGCVEVLEINSDVYSCAKWNPTYNAQVSPCHRLLNKTSTISLEIRLLSDCLHVFKRANRPYSRKLQ